VDDKRLTPVEASLRITWARGGQCDDCIGEEVTSKVAAMQNGQVLLLENVRFHKKRDFAKQLASNADVYVNDAFGTAHRAMLPLKV